MLKNRRKILGEGVGGGNFEEEIETYKMPRQNKSMYEVSFKSDNGQVLKK